ncbi:MAG: PEP-CTERM sorting domain-containing protein [Fimbriiglobus sp.]|jgi:hypothetical protein|nr:PEP-CTERM sorting domain-containing protein [Fimbriiglobus sp.]
MVPTTALIAALAGTADFAPTLTTAEPEVVATRPDEPLGGAMAFLHPVMTNPTPPATMPVPRHPDQPSRSGGGGGGGGMGGGGMGGGQQLATATTPTTDQIRGAGGAFVPAAPGELTLATATEPTPSVLAPPTDPTTLATFPITPTPDALIASTALPSTSAVVVFPSPNVDPPVVIDPVTTPEPGTMALFALGAVAGGSVAVRKWFRRNR